MNPLVEQHTQIAVHLHDALMMMMMMIMMIMVDDDDDDDDDELSAVTVI